MQSKIAVMYADFPQCEAFFAYFRSQHDSNNLGCGEEAIVGIQYNKRAEQIAEAAVA